MLLGAKVKEGIQPHTPGHGPCCQGCGSAPARWALMATSTDVVPFLKASWGFSPSFYFLRVKIQDPRIGQWRHSGVAIFLKTSSWSPQQATLRRLCGEGVFAWRSSARFASCPSLVEFPWCCSLVCGQRGSVPGGGRLPVAFLRRRGSVDGVRVRWLALG
jgi:hypothetical protein